MEIKIQTLHFDAAEALNDYIEKKVARLERHCPDATAANFVLKLVKPESACNKTVALTLNIPGHDIRVEKTCDTFEEAIDQCLDVAKRSIEKFK